MNKTDKILTELAVIKEQNKNMAKDTELIPQMMEKLNKHEQTLYGVTGKNGLTGNVKVLMQALYGIEAIVAATSALVLIFRDHISQFFTGGK